MSYVEVAVCLCLMIYVEAVDVVSVLQVPIVVRREGVSGEALITWELFGHGTDPATAADFAMVSGTLTLPSGKC